VPVTPASADPVTPLAIAAVAVTAVAVRSVPAIRAALLGVRTARVVLTRGEPSPRTPLGTAGPGHAAWRADTPARAGAATAAWPLGGHGATGFEELILPAFVSMKRRFLS
jgi:hypothetical protein